MFEVLGIIVLAVVGVVLLGVLAAVAALLKLAFKIVLIPVGFALAIAKFVVVAVSQFGPKIRG